MSIEGGNTFTSASVVPGMGDDAQGFGGSQRGLLMSKLAVNDAGAIALVTSTFRQGRSSHVWLVHGRVKVTTSLACRYCMAEAVRARGFASRALWSRAAAPTAANLSSTAPPPQQQQATNAQQNEAARLGHGR